MRDTFWKILAIAVAAAAVLLLLSGRFNLVSTVFGTILSFLALSVRLDRDASLAERGSHATVGGLCLLLAVGRLLEPLWDIVPMPLTHELVVSWAVLSVAAWLLARRAIA